MLVKLIFNSFNINTTKCQRVSMLYITNHDFNKLDLKYAILSDNANNTMVLVTIKQLLKL